MNRKGRRKHKIVIQEGMKPCGCIYPKWCDECLADLIPNIPDYEITKQI